ncbi:CHAD domain-containing protein [Maritimibacter sp. HL-12]|uniref:CHAD domain-containing protein n=1 Tax=Maritimibacter sp. HL-12 TaxID=1162418 RepID=UPI000A0EEE36|nr:CHAD domain-containing protein [Maritimibacter sp. HL-12]SMH32541.1 CHAD domain-containing protein [Maritimibacter sp. HL-12]
MPKRFKPTRGRIEKQFRRIARKRLDHALAALDGDDPTGAALHNARTDVKRLRSQFKLARPAFKAYRRENVALRDAARAVSGLRDDTAMVETFDRLAATLAPDEAEALAPVRAALSHVAPGPDDAGAQLAAFRRTLAEVRDRSEAWRISGRGFKPLRKGLKKTYKNARQAMRDADDSGAPTAFHEWRKRVKAHWYQSRMLANIAPKKMNAHIKRAGKLGELLGEHHDLVTFNDRLDTLDIAPGLRDRMRAVVTAERRRIEPHAFAQGDRLLHDKPGTLVRRWKRRWNRRAD